VGFAVVELPLMASCFAASLASDATRQPSLLAELTDACVSLARVAPAPMLVHARTLTVASVLCPTVDHAVATIADTVSLRQQTLARWLQPRRDGLTPADDDHDHRSDLDCDVDAHVAVTAVRAAIFNSLAVVDAAGSRGQGAAGFEDADGGHGFIDCDCDGDTGAEDAVTARVAAAMRKGAVMRGRPGVDPDAAGDGPGAVVQVPPRVIALAESCSRRGRGEGRGNSTCFGGATPAARGPVSPSPLRSTAAPSSHRDGPRSPAAEADHAERAAFGKLDALYGVFRRHSTFPAFGRFLDALHLSVPWEGGAARGTLDKSIRSAGSGSSTRAPHTPQRTAAANDSDDDDDDIVVVRSQLTAARRRGGPDVFVDDTAMPFSDFARVAEAVALHRYPLSRLDKTATPTQQRLSAARSVAAFVDDALARTGLDAAASASHRRLAAA
jgi:hypothetical protein